MSKPVVQYIGQVIRLPIKDGCRMLVRAMDHPLGPDQEILSSRIVREDLATGEIETRNTIYRPVQLPALCEERDAALAKDRS